MERIEFYRQLTYLFTHPGKLKDIITGELYRPEILMDDRGAIYPQKVRLISINDLRDDSKAVDIEDLATLQRYELIETAYV